MFVNHPFPEEWRRGPRGTGGHRRGPGSGGREAGGSQWLRARPLPPAARGTG